MTLNTIADARAHLGISATTLGDDELQLLLDASEQDINDAIGPVANVTEWLSAAGPLLLLATRASAVVSVTENDSALDPTDFSIYGRRLTRLDTGARPDTSWYGQVVVTYAVDDIDRRKVAQLGLIQIGLDTRISGSTESERIGDWSETFATSDEARAKRADVMATLGGRLVIY